MVDRQEPALPPIYRAARVEPTAGSPRAVLVRQTAESPEGTLFWSDAQGRLQLALLLVPEGPFDESAPVAIAAVIALGDAIGALAPPIVGVTNTWPDRIEVNGGLVGGVTLDRVGPDLAVPERLVLGVEIAVASDPGHEPGHRPELTSLSEEGCGEITPVLLLESFARHFLAWLHRWEEDGFVPLRSAWRVRGPRPGTPVVVAIGGKAIPGRFRDLGAAGELILDHDGMEHGLSLAEALAAGPSWSLP